MTSFRNSGNVSPTWSPISLNLKVTLMCLACGASGCSMEGVPGFVSSREWGGGLAVQEVTNGRVSVDNDLLESRSRGTSSFSLVESQVRPGGHLGRLSSATMILSGLVACLVCEVALKRPF